MATKSGSDYVPDRGDVVWLSFDPQAGHEQAGHRPAVVLSPAAYNRGYPFEVAMPAEAHVHGVILADHLKSVDRRARNADRIERLPEATLIKF